MLFNYQGMKYEFDGKGYPTLGHSPQALLVLILIGKGKISFLHDLNLITQDINYSTLPFGTQSKPRVQAYSDFSTAYYAPGRFDQLIKQSNTRNISFYKDLLLEFSNFFIQKNKGSHTAAFIFLYRLLERFSYAIPLLFAKNESSYFGTFTSFKELFSENKNSGEFSFFNKFLKKGHFIDNTILDSSLTISFTSANGLADKYFLAINSKCADCLTGKDPLTLEVNLEFKTMLDFMVRIRNRFCHYQFGQGTDNISMSDIYDSDEFFECLNDHFCNFVSIIALHIIANDLNK